MSNLAPSRTFAAMIVTLVSGGMFSQNADAADFRHLDNLALSLQRQAAQMIGEVRHHYRHTGDYRHMISDTYEIYRLAAHIHDLVHHHSSVHHIQSDVNSLDRKFHHLENLVSHVNHHPHGGHIHGDTFHIHTLLTAMEDSLHHLQDDIAQLTDPHHGHGHHVIVPRPHGHGHYGHGRNGIRVGNDRFSIRFGW